MKASELMLKPAAELRGELMKLRKEQFSLRLQRATGQAVKPDQFGKVRRSIARLKTALRAGQIAAPAAAVIPTASTPVKRSAGRTAARANKGAAKTGVKK